MFYDSDDSNLSFPWFTGSDDYNLYFDSDDNHFYSTEDDEYNSGSSNYASFFEPLYEMFRDSRREFHLPRRRNNSGIDIGRSCQSDPVRIEVPGTGVLLTNGSTFHTLNDMYEFRFDTSLNDLCLRQTRHMTTETSIVNAVAEEKAKRKQNSKGRLDRLAEGLELTNGVKQASKKQNTNVQILREVFEKSKIKAALDEYKLELSQCTTPFEISEAQIQQILPEKCLNQFNQLHEIQTDWIHYAKMDDILESNEEKALL